MWLRIRSLIIKELLAVLRDPRGRRALIMPTILQLLIFPLAATQEVKNIRMAVLNKDWGKPSRDLIARFEGAPYFLSVQYLESESEVERAIDGREAMLVLHIGPDFSRRVAAGRTASVQLVLDGRRSNTAQILQGYATSVIDRYNAELAASRGNVVPATAIAVRSWFNPNLTTTWNTIPGLLVILTTLITLMVTALSVARERELGTFEQLLVSPLQPLEIVAGKTVPPLLIGMAQGALILTVGTLVYGVPFTGSSWLLFASMVAFLVSVIGVGLFVSSLSQTQQQAVLGTFVFMVPAIMLSGFASPIENMPDWLQPITMANPLRHFLVIAKGLFLKDMPAVEVFHNTIPLVLIGLVTLPVATWLFRHRMS
jgi:ABC-2 type transport system permease protein